MKQLLQFTRQPIKVTFFFCLLILSLATTLQAQPATPAGFVANPASGAGEVFLAVGPNDVADPDIEYRLFYSPTASAPGDPLTATEYTFGSTPGDGGGNNAFGFTLAGLTPGTDYTFWLYQYNTATMMFSATPATATQMSGAAGGPPDAPVGFVCNTPSGSGSSGEVFLALGPNDVGDPDIVYELYYSLTASAPSDPLTATQYSFGSTPGDGNGDAAFGFTLASLAPGTDYSFWIYQYNTSLMLHSDPTACMTTSSGVMLPVTWLAPLSAKVMDDSSVKISWSVAEQLNNDKFIIEHSRNGVDFLAISSIKGEGTTNAVQEYTFTHKSPVTGDNYYRIQQVDYDGTASHSNITKVWYTHRGVRIYPNPASSVFSIHSTESTNVRIMDLYGRMLKNLSLVEGENNISLADLPNGRYILHFEDGQVARLLKQ